MRLTANIVIAKRKTSRIPPGAIKSGGCQSDIFPPFIWVQSKVFRQPYRNQPRNLALFSSALAFENPGASRRD
ncbi:MAG: hypothetical protein LBB55_06300, partial [Zoogloeaceae bacterium]|nr:hypothetical protein [Zoogloeaceae bacterium]